MTSAVRWLLVAGISSIGMAACSSSLPSSEVQPSTASSALSVEPPTPLQTANMQPLSDDQLSKFLTAARQAETISDPLRRCLAYPDPPGLAWSKAVTAAYCHYQFDPWVKPGEMRRLIQTGHAAELDRRLAEARHAQLTQPNAQAVLDRTFIINFRNSSDEIRALVDAWKRQLPASPYALAASGIVYVQMAQEARGSKYAAKTPRSSFEAMYRLLERAHSDLDRAVALDPKLTPAYDAMLYAAVLESDDAYALNAARQGLAADPSNYTIYARLVWMAQPKWGGSVEEMQHFIADAQRHADENPLLKLLVSENSGGEAYVENCQCDETGELNLYRQVFAEAAPVGMLMSGGWAAENRNAIALSVIYRSELLRFDPSKLDHRASRAFELPSFGHSDWALAEGNALIALNPQYENAFDVRGLAYESLGNTARAIDDYEQALRLDPTDTWTLVRLGNIYVQSAHDWDKGWMVANRLIQTSPENPAGWLLRASIQRNQPREGLDQTASDFVARFGTDPAQRGAIEQMHALQAR